MKILLFLVLFFICTLQIVLPEDSPIIVIPSYRPFWGQVSYEIEKGSKIIIDRLAQPAHLDRVRRWNRGGREEQDYVHSAGINSVRSLLANSVREAFVANIKIDEARESWRQSLKNAFLGSVGNTIEKERDIVSSTYSLSSAVWEEREETLSYGYQITDSPYVYASMLFDSVYAKRPTVFTGFRFHYNPPTASELEVDIKISILKKWNLKIGASADPIDWDNEKSRTLSLRLEKFFYDRSGVLRAFYCGTKVDHYGTKIDIGISGRF